MTPTHVHAAVYFADCERPYWTVRYLNAGCPTLAGYRRQFLRQRGVVRVELHPCGCVTSATQAAPPAVEAVG